MEDYDFKPLEASNPTTLKYPFEADDGVGAEYANVDEDDEALSLCDLPLNNNATSRRNSSEDMSFRLSHRSSLSETSDFFEFFNDFSSDMVPADDIILCGKLVPFKDNSLYYDQIQKKSKSEFRKPPIHRRRSESFSKLQSSVTRSNSISPSGSSSLRFMMRNSRSLDYRRLCRSSSSVTPEMDRNSSTRSVAMSDVVAKKATKPRWYSLMFGAWKVPHEMDLNDIKNRQVRRNPSTTMFPATDTGGNVIVDRSSEKVSWKILKALSCKDYTSVAVTTSFPMPQAS